MFAWILRGKVLEFWRRIFPLLSMEISNLSKVFFFRSLKSYRIKKMLKEDFFLQVDWAVGQCGKPFRNRQSFDEWHVFWQMHGNSLSCSPYFHLPKEILLYALCAFSVGSGSTPTLRFLVRTRQLKDFHVGQVEENEDGLNSPLMKEEECFYLAERRRRWCNPRVIQNVLEMSFILFTPFGGLHIKSYSFLLRKSLFLFNTC